MSKTNFKCMFLIDDKLYNKAILRERANENTNIIQPRLPNCKQDNNIQTNIKGLIPNSTYLTSIPSIQQITAVNPEGNMSKHSDFRKVDDLTKVENAQQDEIVSSEKDQQTPIASSSSTNAPPHKISEVEDMELDQNEGEKDDCECNETLSQKNGTEEGKVQFNKKITSQKPLSIRAKKRRRDDDDDDNLSNDSDWEDLKLPYEA